jgi:hypothetical protein
VFNLLECDGMCRNSKKQFFYVNHYNNRMRIM